MPVTLRLVSTCDGPWGRSLRKTTCKDCQDNEAGSQSCAHHSSHNDERYRQNEKVGEQVRAGDPDQHFAHSVSSHAMQISKCARLPSVARLWWTGKDVQNPWDQRASNSEDQDAVKYFL